MASTTDWPTIDDEDEDPCQVTRLSWCSSPEFNKMPGSLKREDTLRGLSDHDKCYYERGGSAVHTAMKGLARDWLLRQNPPGRGVF